MQPRVGFRPTSPHHAAGPLIEPPAWVACAIGTMPDATAAARPGATTADEGSPRPGSPRRRAFAERLVLRCLTG
jgi:hypothetical protein